MQVFIHKYGDNSDYLGDIFHGYGTIFSRIRECNRFLASCGAKLATFAAERKLTVAAGMGANRNARLMNTNTFIVSAALCLTAADGMAQSGVTKTYEIRGTVCDSLARAPEAFATVRLLSADGKTPLKVTTAKAQGEFRILAPKASDYVLELVSLGKAPLRREVSVSDERPVVALDTLYIKEYDSTLGTATVVAQRPLVRAELDKIGYSVSDDPEAKTATVIDILRKVPMVTVDGQDNIKVNGQSSFKVYVNGKPNAMMSANPSTILKAYPAASIKKIEVITNPGAKYDAEGVAGVLNIVTDSHTAASGYSLTLTGALTTQGERGSAVALAQAGKFMLSAQYGTGRNDQGTYLSDVDRELYDVDERHYLRKHNENDDPGRYQFGNLEASYEFSPKDLFSLSAGLHSWRSTNDAYNRTQVFNRQNELIYAYLQKLHNRYLYQNVNASADFQHSFTDRSKLTFSYQFSHNPSGTKSNTLLLESENLPDGLGLRDLRTDPDKLSTEQTAQVDFTTPLDKKGAHTLAVGMKYINRINRSNSVEYAREAGTANDFQLDEEASLRYRHRSDIAAAYLEYSLNLDKWSAMAGSRYEFNRVRVSYPDGKRPSFSKTLSDWVPSLTVCYSVKPTMLLKWGYNLRISRPDIDFLSPYRESLTPEAVDYGNPGMESENGHNLNFTFSTFSPKLTVNASLNYAFSNNGITEYQFIDQSGVQNTTYDNIQHSRQLTLSLFLNWMATKTTSLNINAASGYERYSASRTGNRTSGFTCNVWAGVSQSLPWNLKLGLDGGVSSKGVSLQGRGNAFYFYMLNLKRSFLKEDRLTVTLAANNFFNRYIRVSNRTESSQFCTQVRTRVQLMQFAVSVSYRLGSLKESVKKVDRSISNDDVLSGKKDGGAQQGGN